MTDQLVYVIDSIPARADVVVVGAGIVGVSAAYELTRRGVSDVVVVDRGSLFRTGGSTSHAPGGIFQNNGSRTVSKLAQESVALFRELNADGDGSPVYFDTGSIEVATTEPRWRDLHRKVGYARAWGLEAALLSPDEVATRLPLIDAGAILGGIAVAGDGVLKAIPFVERLAARAGAGGARFVGGTRVTGFDRSGAGGQVVAVETDRGRIAAAQVLICAGIWGPVVGEMAGIRVPLQPCAHPYVRSTPLPKLAGRTYPTEPLWRHQDHSMYLAQWDERYVVGSYRHEPLTVDARDIDDSKAAPADLPFDDQIFEPGWREAQRLVPALREAGQTDRVYGMFSFTPDANSLIGEVASVPGLFLAEAVWVTHGPGAGRLAADLMTTGECGEELDLREVDPNRFAGHQLANRYVRTRGAQNYREVYDVIHPRDQISAPQGMRRSPFYGRQVELGAVFAESGGWERPQWFAANADLPVPTSGERDDWSRYRWSPIVAAEHVATRERAGLFDLSTFQKIELSGPGALAALERLSCSVVDRPVGRVTYALFLNERGGIETDLTVTRLAEDHFLLLCGASSGPRDLGWIARRTRGMAGVVVRDVTSAWCGLGLWGPAAHAILEPLAGRSLDVETFPLFTSREMDVAGVPATLLRLSYVGEYGWEIHVPTEYGGALWDAVWESGRAHGLVACGGAAMDTLRLEKGYRALGTDLRAEFGPVAAGLGFAVRREEGGRGKGEGRTDGEHQMRLCALVIEDGTVVVGKEPVLHGERVVGYVASAGFGPTVGASIVTAYLPVELAEPRTRLDVEWFGVRHAATVAREPLYDPEGVAMRESRARRHATMAS